MGLGRNKDESILEYQIRICSERESLELTWDEVAQLLNEELNENYGESKYRKWWYAFKEGMNYVNNLQAEREENVKQYIGEQKKDFQMLKSGEQSSTIVAKLSEEEMKDSDFLLRLHGYDPDKWEITSAKQSIWNNSLDSELYSSKITVKPRAGFNWNEENIKKIFKTVSKDYQACNYEIAHISQLGEEPVEKDKMLLIGISDLHYGLLAKDNLSEEYNMEIAKERFNAIITDVVQRKIDNKDIEKAILLIGNDFLNADNLQGTTARHMTPQDQETNWFEMITSATEMLIEAIEKMRFFFPEIEVINVKGNHDETSMFGIMQTLNAYYRNVDSVTINTSSKFRQYIRYGVNLIGLSHNERLQDVPKIMAAEAKEDWGETSYHCFLLGHLHVRKQFEDSYGVDIYNLPSCVSASAWTSSQGYCGTNKMSQTFVFDKNKGLVEIINTVI